MAQQYIKDVAYWAKAYQLSVSDFEESVIEESGRNIFTYTIHFLSGFKVAALSSRPANLRSKKGRLRIDEAAFHEDLEELIKAALAVVMWGGSVGIWSTHDGEDNDFNKLIDLVKAGDRHYSHHHVSLDEALSEGFYQRICLVQNQPWTLEGEFAWRSQMYQDYGDAADEELGCIPKKRQNGDLVYHRFDRILNACTDIVKLDDRLHIGMDFNVTNMSAVVHVIRNGFPRAVGEIAGVEDTPAMVAAIKSRYPNHSGLISVYPDASGQSRKSTNASTSDVAMLRQAGFLVVVDGANPSVKDRINAMNTAFCNPIGDRLYLVNDKECKAYVESLEKQAWKNGEPDKSKGFDHLPDGSGYFICKFMPIAAPSESTFAASVRSRSTTSRFGGRR